MKEDELIPTIEFCEIYQIELSFINSLAEYGLVEISTIQQKKFIHRDAIEDLEKFIRLHYDLDINMEGIDAIRHILQRMKDMQEELIALRSRLRLQE